MQASTDSNCSKAIILHHLILPMKKVQWWHLHQYQYRA